MPTFYIDRILRGVSKRLISVAPLTAIYKYVLHTILSQSIFDYNGYSSSYSFAGEVPTGTI